MLPAAAAQEITALVKSTDDKRQFHSPSPSTLSRARFQVDVAYMLILREKFQVGQGARVNLMVDSSPQGGRDYSLMVMIVVGVESLPLVYLQSQCWIILDIAGDDGPVPELREHQEHIKQLRALIKTHAPRPVVRGRAQTTLADKLHAVMHGLLLESGSLNDLSLMVRSVSSITTDFGVESGSTKIAPLYLEALFPWCKPDAAYEPVAHADDVNEFALAAPVSVVADLIGSVHIAGMLHILHNLTGAL